MHKRHRKIKERKWCQIKEYKNDWNRINVKHLKGQYHGKNVNKVVSGVSAGWTGAEN